MKASLSIKETAQFLSAILEGMTYQEAAKELELNSDAVENSLDVLELRILVVDLAMKANCCRENMKKDE